MLIQSAIVPMCLFLDRFLQLGDRLIQKHICLTLNQMSADVHTCTHAPRSPRRRLGRRYGLLHCNMFTDATRHLTGPN